MKTFLFLLLILLLPFQGNAAQEVPGYTPSRTSSVDPVEVALSKIDPRDIRELNTTLGKFFLASKNKSPAERLAAVRELRRHLKQLEQAGFGPHFNYIELLKLPNDQFEKALSALMPMGDESSSRRFTTAIKACLFAVGLLHCASGDRAIVETGLDTMEALTREREIILPEGASPVAN